ncbi:hypothetical protein FRB94_013018 [Tulasnella sp. JGI-2019a]|nr:hypothetical protein FRB94_013018 [Tulasnella sp. JGI-2019a]
MARRENAFKRLGGVFHFTRDDQARNKMAILIIARQLASWQFGRLRSAIAAIIEENLDIAHLTPDDQFRKLILGPLESLGDKCPTVVMIFDAIDECEPAYAELLLRSISNGFGELPTAVKFLLTSRGAPWLQKHYESEPINSHLEVYSLGDEKKELVDRDIEAFLKEELPELVRSWVDNAADWPGEEKRKALVRKSQGLFIFASTAVRIITDRNIGRDPNEELKRLLSSDRHSHLDGIYAQVIEGAFPNTIDLGTLGLFREVVGALVVAQEPININTLATLLCPYQSQLREFTNRIRLQVLIYLQAVLIIPDVNSIEQAATAQPIQFIHTSFVDYLTNRAGGLLIQPSERHECLATACFRTMQSLTRNICDLDPSLLNSEVKDLGQRVRERIPPVLQYACVNIAAHVSRVDTGSADIRGLVEGFANERLMHWLESLSLIGRAHEAVAMVSLMEGWLKSSTAPAPTRLAAPSPPPSTAEFDKPDDVTSLFYDLRRFIMEFMDPIVASALHIYSSALALTPSETELSCRYGHLAEGGLRVIRGRTQQWSQILWTASKHSKCVNCIAVSPDSTTIVSGSDDGTLRLWDARTGAAIGRAMVGHSNWVNCVAISPDSTIIISGSYDKTIRRWNARTGEAIGEVLVGHSAHVRCVVVSPDGTIVVSGSDDKTLCRWDAKTGVIIGKAMKGHTGCIRCITVSPDSTTIVSGSDDRTLCLWDAKTGAVIREGMTGHTGWVNCVAVLPNNTTIVSGSDDGTLRLWDAKTGAAIGKAMEGHTGKVNCIAISPNGATIVSGSYDKMVRQWDSKTGESIGKAMEGHSAYISCVVVSPDSTTIISGSGDCTLHLWDAQTGAAIGKAMTGHTSWVNCVVISPDGTTVVSGSDDKTLCRWDTQTEAAIRTATVNDTYNASCIAISPDNTTIISGSYDHTLCLWDAKTGVVIKKAMEGHFAPIFCVTVSPDSTTIVSGSDDGTLRLWDAKTGAAIGEVMEGHTASIHCVTVSPDSTTIVSGSDDWTLRLWDAKTGAAIGEVMKGHTDLVNCVAISPDGAIIVSGSEDKSLHLWDAKTGEAIGAAMMGHTGWVTCVAVSPDSTTIVSSSHNNTLCLWDAKTGAAIGKEMKVHTSNITSVAFSDDSGHIVSTSEETAETFVWNCTSQIWLSKVESARLNMSNLTFALDGDGWVLGSGSKRMFWLPAALRGQLVGRSHVIVVLNKKIPVFDVSTCLP